MVNDETLFFILGKVLKVSFIKVNLILSYSFHKKILLYTVESYFNVPIRACSGRQSELIIEKFFSFNLQYNSKMK